MKEDPTFKNKGELMLMPRKSFDILALYKSDYYYYYYYYYEISEMYIR